MNVIISNKYQSTLESLNIDVIKSLHGEFDVDDIISQFQNFFFQRMILDITALKDYRDVKTLQKLSISLDMDKVILLLDDSVDEGGSSDYLSKLISMGIYNFTKNAEGIMYLYNNPNSYRDVAHIQQLDTTSTEQVVVDNYNNPIQQGTRVIGVKNVTKQSGATTLVYMMKKQLEKHYNVIGIELNKDDFKFFNDKQLYTTTNNEIGNMIAKYNDKDVILLDINDSVQAESLCNEVIYLVEPSVIKLNKLMFTNRNAFKNLKGKKIILNQSLLTSKDVLDFEYESGAKIYFNMPPLDERERTIFILNQFLHKLGFSKQQTAEQDKKISILGLFGK
jgi:hypothetical protein